MIRINLLGQARPKAKRRSVPLESTMQWLLGLAAVIVAVVVLFYLYNQRRTDMVKAEKEISTLRAQKAELEQLKQQVEMFGRQKDLLQQRISVIEQLQRDRSGGQELLDMVAKTVVRIDELWLTSLGRKGDSVSIEGKAASVKSVADLISQLKRSGYFDKIEIKETHQDDRIPVPQVFLFTLSADVSPTRGRPQPQPQTQPARKS